MKSLGSWGLLIAIVTLFASAWLYYCWDSGVRSARRHTVMASIPVRAIRIEPILNDRFSLVTNEVVITDPKTIADITSAVWSAPKYFPNHPATRWDCDLEILSGTGIDYYWANNTVGQGTILYYRRTFITSTLRSDTLGAILEKAAKAP